ncbi:AAA family ATPase [Amycolatopsis australiensis]|uniref:AAA family ATPase n=1 Tax=Amycolatopsis australiensis TaxID=546364 RepID=UPI000931624E
MAGSLLILTGPPGAGKSTVARLVAEDAPRATVHLHTDSFYVWIRTRVRAALPARGRAAERRRARCDRRGRLRLCPRRLRRRSRRCRRALGPSALP